MKRSRSDEASRRPLTRLQRRFLFQTILLEVSDDKLAAKYPRCGGSPLDLFELHVSANEHGGGEEMHRRKLWQRAHHAIHLPETATSSGSKLNKEYRRHLKALEAAARWKSGGDQCGVSAGGAWPCQCHSRHESPPVTLPYRVGAKPNVERKVYTHISYIGR